MFRSLRGVLVLATTLLAVLVAGCGTPMATVRTTNGTPVMLLGYDPVAYFLLGEPRRGSAEHQVSLPGRTYYFASDRHKRLFEAEPLRYEPQYGGFCASGAAFGIKLGSDPTAWQIHQGRLFIFGDVLGKTAWQLDPDWNVRHADALWPEMRHTGWRLQSLLRYAEKVPHYLTGPQIRAQWQARNPGQTFPEYDPGHMLKNLFLKSPGWRAAEGYGQEALGYPQ